MLYLWNILSVLVIFEYNAQFCISIHIDTLYGVASVCEKNAHFS